MTGGSIIELVAWLAVAVAGAVMLTQALGWNGTRSVAVVQTLTPYLILSTTPIVIGAAAVGEVILAMPAAAIVAAGIWLARPVLSRTTTAAVPGGGFRLGAVNLLYSNDRVGEVAKDLAARNLDVIVFSEYTSEHQGALLASALAGSFEHRHDRPGMHASGTAVWSRWPARAGDTLDTSNATIDLTIVTGVGAVRVLAVHPTTPVEDFAGWLTDLTTIGAAVRSDDGPVAIVGDFNASYWHPCFRSLLAAGYTDAHIALGRGLSCSWPTDSWVPPFVRLDHALTRGLMAIAVEEFDVPGSDHRGFVVTVAPTPRPAP